MRVRLPLPVMVLVTWVVRRSVPPMSKTEFEATLMLPPTVIVRLPTQQAMVPPSRIRLSTVTVLLCLRARMPVLWSVRESPGKRGFDTLLGVRSCLPVLSPTW